MEISAEFRHIVDTLPAFVWCARPDGSIAFLNRRGLDYTGFSPNQISGWSWTDTDILHPDDTPALFDAWRAIVASGREGEIQARMRRFDGEYRWFLFRVSPLYDGAGGLAAWWGVDIEIDAQKRTEEQLREALAEAQASKDQLERVIDTIPGLVWSSLPDGHIDFLNQRWREYTGLSLSEASGWGWRVAIHSDDLPGLESYWRSMLSSGQAGEYEARLRRFDGTYRWFLYRGVPLFSDAGALIKWYGQSTDIEDRKRAEALLAGEKRLLEMMARGDALALVLEALCVLVEESSPGCLCGILLVDSTGTRLFHGAAPSLPPGYTAAIDGRPIDAEAGPCGMAALLKEQVLVIDAASDVRWDSYAWGPLALAHGLRACWSTPIASSEGAILGTFAVYWRLPRSPAAEDQTVIERMTHLVAVAIERDHTAAALQKNEAHLARAQRLSATGSFSYVAATGELGLSEETHRICGFDPAAKISPGAMRDRIHPEDLPLFLNMLQSTGREFHFDCRVLLPDGSVRHLQVIADALRDDAGRLVEWVGAVRDETDRKRSEDALNELRSDMAHVARVATLGEMTASIAHEINQPLGAIVNNANASLRWLAANNAGQAQQSLALIVADGHRASDILARIRAMVRKSPLQRRPLDLNDAIREVLTLAGSQIEKHGAAIESQLSDGIPLVRADRVQMQQVVLNLVMNAIEAMSGTPDGLRRVTVGSRHLENATLLVSVCDQGPGFDPDDLERLFEAFYSTKPAGLGMGLAISRGIVEAHEGQLWATINADRGATFQFTLPAAPGDAS